MGVDTDGNMEILLNWDNTSQVCMHGSGRNHVLKHLCESQGLEERLKSVKPGLHVPNVVHRPSSAQPFCLPSVYQMAHAMT